MTKEKTYIKLRCKAKCGLSLKWTIGMKKDGQWKAIGVGDAKMRNRTVPTEFIPFEISNAVLGAFAPSFATPEEAEQFVRSL